MRKEECEILENAFGSHCAAIRIIRAWLEVYREILILM
ncbi:hypothetical protein CFter6_3354 [Collimonas fungivorans]|uniref:Uncharacterized protein n=1 Tax=Collimonas fungivorans TaxID=158899 RepID=A0A127PDV8_9BURK|nr:hypothetical protein CFter6_3354 [Collimonas fungivorans]